MTFAAWFAAVVTVAAVVGWVVARGAHWASRLFLAVAFGTSAVWAAALMGQPSTDPELTSARPDVGAAEGYGTSDTCRACHPGHYRTWHDSFHRTMTQTATPEAILAPFDGRVLVERDNAFRVFSRDERYYASEVDAETGDALPDATDLRIVLTTGSHHVQAYWYAEEGGALVQLPFVYFIHEERWLANDDSFLQAPYEDDAELDRYVWTEGCMDCHSTGGPWQPESLGMDPDETESSTVVAELGIACERCHGPAEEHAEANRSPARRYALHASDEADPTIVNPRRLDAARSASLCGHCHTVAEDLAGSSSRAFRPGDRLDEHLDFGAMFRTVDEAVDVRDVDELPDGDRDIVESFWTNGATRVAGREYDAMIRSGCYAEGGMSCISCHTMHEVGEDEQLPHDADNQAYCGSCHEDIVRDVSAHTHHEEASSGSECVNCHMPYASYGLLSATRSHRLDSPTASGVRGREAPNACNLCHLDQSLAFTADKLTEWYGAPEAELPADIADVPAGALWMLRGDAVQRALAAWHAGWEPAREASDVESIRPALGALMQDHYSAVRQIAGRTFRTHDASIPVDIDALTEEPQRALRLRIGTTNARLDRETVLGLLRDRDRTYVSVPE